MSEFDLLVGMVVLGLIGGGIYVLGVVLNVVTGHRTNTDDEHMDMGCAGVVLIGIFFCVLYGAVRFVKWAWE